MINWETQTVKFIRETSRWEKEKNVSDILPAAISLLREMTASYLALRVDIEDDYTAKVKDATPSFFNDFILHPEPIKKFLEANPDISYWPDISIQQSKVFEDLFPALSSAVIMPVHVSGYEIVIILGWSEPQLCDTPFRNFIEIVTARVKGILWRRQLETSLLNEVSRLSAILQSMPQAVVFIGDNSAPGWINEKAAALLHIGFAGEQQTIMLSKAMGELRNTALNKDLLATDINRLFTEPQSVLNQNWEYSNDRVLKVSTIPVHYAHVKGRLWIFEEVINGK